MDDEIASSEEEFLSDLDDLNLTYHNWTPPESELRRQVAIILSKINPAEYNYSGTINYMLYKYLKYINDKRRTAKINRIADCVERPTSQLKKTELLVQREIDDKKLNRHFYYSPDEPSDFVCQTVLSGIVRNFNFTPRRRNYVNGEKKQLFENTQSVTMIGHFVRTTLSDQWKIDLFATLARKLQN